MSPIAAFTLLLLLFEAGPSIGDLRFEQFPASAGSTRVDRVRFEGEQARYRRYRSAIADALAHGPDYNGRFAVVTIGCGTDCTVVLLLDTASGEIHDLFDFGNVHLEVETRRSSSLMLSAHGVDYDRGTPPRCLVRAHVWTGSGLSEIARATVDEGCEGALARWQQGEEEGQ